MKRRFYTLDVFTKKRYQGNPLAVVLDTDDLSDEDMQGIAREFNLSETVFIFSPDVPEHDAKVRIFTPGKELAFAGHPVIGTAILLSRLAGSSGGRIQLELPVGSIDVALSFSDQGDDCVASFIAPDVPSNYRPYRDYSLLNEAVSLSESDIGCGSYVPAFVTSAGRDWLFVPVRDLDVIGNVYVDMHGLSKVLIGSNAHSVYVYTTDCVDDGHNFHGRMFAPALGISEDPATGSAAVAFPGVIHGVLPLTDGVHPWVLEQGYEMGRPSQFHLSVMVKDSEITSIDLSGSAVVISSGELWD